MAKSHVLLLFLYAAMGGLMIGEVGGMNHIIGKSLGWTIPQNASFYQDWAAPRTFAVGDKLVFLYSSGMHNVIEVSKADYDACTQKNTISVHFSGPTVLKLAKPGDHYFICGLRQHCLRGQKLSIKVAQGQVPVESGADSAKSLFSFRLVSVLLIFVLFMPI
ncbi:hypothetical protein AAG906_008872 [Vitis piasezkii]|eukprot:XP_019081572.1 PREDICTED: mavicyanin-like [Vitis vinifera]